MMDAITTPTQAGGATGVADPSTGSVLCLLMDPEGQQLRPALYLPHNAGPPQLLELINTNLQNVQEEKLPYAFYISDQELVVQLGAYLQKNKVSLEKVLKIVCLPQAIFRICAVNWFSATIVGHSEAVLSVMFW